MAEPTYARDALRREICRQLQMPFFTYFASSSIIDASSTTLKILDASLAQRDDFWKGAWYYQIDGGEAGEISKVVSFIELDNALFLQTPLTGSPSAGETYELHSGFNAVQIHAAINRSIEEGAFPAFFDVVTDETLILEEDSLDYSLTSLSSLAYKILKVWIEVRSNVSRGLATAGAATTLTDTNGNFNTSADSDWRISIYDGTGKGQIRTVSSATASVVTVSVAWTVNPDTTSKYAFWDGSEDLEDWYRVRAVRFDSKEWPNILRLVRNYEYLEGMRIRIEYMSKPSAIATESATTVVPQGYIVPRVLSYLYDRKRTDNRVDRRLASDESDKQFELSEIYRRTNAFQAPDGTVWIDRDDSNYLNIDSQDPLSWQYG